MRDLLDTFVVTFLLTFVIVLALTNPALWRQDGGSPTNALTPQLVSTQAR
jgi:hypothetical protein